MSLRLSTENQVLIKEGWEAELWEESQEGDILSGLTGVFSEKARTVPDGIVNRVMLPAGEYIKNIGMLLDLDGAGTLGGGKLLTTESLALKQLQAYANDVRHGVNLEQFGIYAHQLSHMDLMGKVNKLLGRWLAAKRGKHMRQALVQRISDNLAEAPTSLSVGWNKNVLIKNVGDATQPVYDSTLSTFTGNIITALSAAGTGSDSLLDADFWTHLDYYVSSVWKLQPMDSGKYIVTVPAQQARFMKALSDSGSLLGLARTTYSEEIAKRAFAQTLGEIGNFVLLVDPRAPLWVYNTANGTLTAVYRDVGSTDDRNSYVQGSGNNRLYNIGGVWGKGGITEAIAMKPRYDEELNDVGRLKDVGMSTTYGFKITEFDVDTATDTSRIGQNCAIFGAYAGAGTT